MRNDDAIRTTMMTSRISGGMNAISSSFGRGNARQHAVDGDDPNLLAASKTPRRLHFPSLAADVGPAGFFAVVQHFAVGADERLHAGHQRCAPRSHRPPS